MLLRHLMTTTIVACATFAGLGLSAMAVDDPYIVAATVAREDPADALLGDKVETLLRSDSGLMGSRLRVAASGAVVTLQGLVPDEYALRRALDLASTVQGVREVRNHLAVG